MTQRIWKLAIFFFSLVRNIGFVSHGFVEYLTQPIPSLDKMLIEVKTWSYRDYSDPIFKPLIQIR